MTPDSTRHRADSLIGRLARKRWIPVAAGATAAVLTAGAIATAGGGAAGAATAPQAQSAGNFVDATIGGNPIDQIAALKYARAQAPGTEVVQNPLDVTALNSINLPLTGALQLPTLLGIKLGAANQVAKANVDGSSYGAAGAVNNSGGVSVGGNNNAFPANATIQLERLGYRRRPGCRARRTRPRQHQPGRRLGGRRRRRSATPRPAPPQYKIADVNVELASPVLGNLLGTVGTSLTSALATLTAAAGAGGLPPACNITTGLRIRHLSSKAAPSPWTPPRAV